MTKLSHINELCVILKNTTQKEIPQMNVFVSYSHKDEYFVDKLVNDLAYAEIPVTYDKWLLKIGDSIIYKISEFVSTSDKVIIVLSKNSVESNWVKKELAIAMNGEINGKITKVIPIVLDDCSIPAIINDKLYADFKYEFRYFTSLRDIIESIDDSISNTFARRFTEKIDNESKLEILKKYISNCDIQSIKDYLAINDFFLVTLLGRLWHISESISKIKIKTQNEQLDFIIINGQSGNYEIVLTSLLKPTIDINSIELINAEIKRLNKIKNYYKNNKNELKCLLALQMKKYEGINLVTEYIDEDYWYLKIKILCGRRSLLSHDFNKFRQTIFLNSHEEIEIITYDRLIESIGESIRR